MRPARNSVVFLIISLSVATSVPGQAPPDRTTAELQQRVQTLEQQVKELTEQVKQLRELLALLTGKGAGFSLHARTIAVKTDISAFDGALNMFEVDMGQYPTMAEGLRALVTQPKDPANWHGPYIRKGEVPKDPWGNAYVYVVPGRHNTNSFDLFSCGPDGKEGGDDDIGNWP